MIHRALFLMALLVCAAPVWAQDDDDIEIEVDINVGMENRADGFSFENVGGAEPEPLAPEILPQAEGQETETLPTLVGGGRGEELRDQSQASFIIENGEAIAKDPDEIFVDVDALNDIFIDEGSTQAEISVVKAELASIDLPGLCALSAAGAPAKRLREFVNAEAYSIGRIPLEAFAPCGEMLTFAPDAAPVSLLVRAELIAIADPLPETGPGLVAQVRDGLIDLPVLSASTLKTVSTPLGGLRIVRRQYQIPTQDQAFTFLDLERAPLEAALGAAPDETAIFVAMTGLFGWDKRVLVITVNAGADQSMRLSEIYQVFALTFDQAFLRLLGQK